MGLIAYIKNRREVRETKVRTKRDVAALPDNLALLREGGVFNAPVKLAMKNLAFVAAHGPEVLGLATQLARHIDEAEEAARRGMPGADIETADGLVTGQRELGRQDAVKVMDGFTGSGSKES